MLHQKPNKLRVILFNIPYGLCYIVSWPVLKIMFSFKKMRTGRQYQLFFEKGLTYREFVLYMLDMKVRDYLIYLMLLVCSVVMLLSAIGVICFSFIKFVKGG